MALGLGPRCHNVQQEMAALRADRSMQLSLHFPQSDDSLHVAFLNTRSLHKHIDLIRHDQVLSASHINLYCETRVADTDSSDTYRVNSFQAIICTPVPHRVCVPQYLTEYGLAVYSRLPVLQSCQPVLLANSCGTAECTLVQVAVQPSVILSVVSVYRRPASDLNHFTFTTAMS